MATLDTEALRRACREVAKSTLWQTPEPYDINDIIGSDQIDRTIQAYFAEAEQRAADLAEANQDPNIVTRAVLYLAVEHAIPPMKDDLRWFEDSLDVLLRLVNPITFPAKDGVPFMADVEDAARRYRREADNDSAPSR